MFSFAAVRSTERRALKFRLARETRMTPPGKRASLRTADIDRPGGWKRHQAVHPPPEPLVVAQLPEERVDDLVRLNPGPVFGGPPIGILVAPRFDEIEKRGVRHVVPID